MGLFQRKSFSDRTKYNYEKRVKADNFTFLNESCCKHGQTVFAGDSITELYNLTDFYWEYTERTGLHVYNRGISGDTSDRLLERFYDNVLSIEPKNVVLLVGTNDLNLGGTAETVTENIRKIVMLTKKHCPDTKIIVQSVYPVKNAGKRSNSVILEINAVLREMCESEGLVYADVHPRMTDKNGSFSDDFSFDGLHPNARGFAEATKVILPLLEG